MADPIKIALAEDETLFRKGISFILQRETAFDVVFEAENGIELLAFLKKINPLPDIVLMDLKMPDLNGVETTRAIVQDYPEIKIIALTSYDTKAFIANMIYIGAASYLVKNTTSKELIATIKEVAAKGFCYNAKIMEVLRENSAQLKKTSRFSFDETLTNREEEIIKLVCKQYNTKEIAEKLFISHRTVEGHRNSLLLKTGSKNVAGLVVYAILHDLVTAGDMI
ncbi:MAG TPA: response regulator transcription factor [Flavobacteriaceae bacterium]|nr:response regulator transcription factor [Flavobacteriaceae bacterium]